MEHVTRMELFDRWAASYDQSVQSTGAFPFIGYQDVLDKVVELAGIETGLRVLELGIGTGNLAEKFVQHGCHVWGVDFSERMLEKVRERLPGVQVIAADLLQELPQAVPQSFDRIVSAYVFHEFDLPEKVGLIR